MKELKSYSVVASSEAHNYINGEINLAFEAYDADEVDTAIAEIKAELDKTIAERDGNQVCIDALKQKLEDVNELIKTARQMLEDAKATAYTESVDAGMENRRLKRALWLARAEISYSNQFHATALVLQDRYIRMHPNSFYKRYKGCDYYNQWLRRWANVERKCLAKAEEYK